MARLIKATSQVCAEEQTQCVFSYPVILSGLIWSDYYFLNIFIRYCLQSPIRLQLTSLNIQFNSKELTHHPPSVFE